MYLRISIASPSRGVERRLRTLRPLLTRMELKYRAMKTHGPAFNFFLVCLTEDRAPDFVEQTPNVEGMFQVLAGLGDASHILSLDDIALRELAIDRVAAAIQLVPFDQPDKRAFEALGRRWAASVACN